jgi:Fe-S oxidoreductase
MAGSFGFEKDHYELSMRIGGMCLFPAVNEQPDAIIAATGVSCRQQIAHGTGRTALHPVSLVKQAVSADPDQRPVTD